MAKTAAKTARLKKSRAQVNAPLSKATKARHDTGMRRFLTTSALFVLGIVLVAFLVANRQQVTISFDPFNTTDPAYSFTAPLWAAPAGSLLIGYILGALGMWLSNGSLRQKASERKQKVRELEREVDLANDASVKTASAATRLPALRS